MPPAKRYMKKRAKARQCQRLHASEHQRCTVDTWLQLCFNQPPFRMYGTFSQGCCPCMILQ